MQELLNGAMSQWRRLELVTLGLPSTVPRGSQVIGQSVPPLLKSMEGPAMSLRKPIII